MNVGNFTSGLRSSQSDWIVLVIPEGSNGKGGGASRILDAAEIAVLDAVAALAARSTGTCPVSFMPGFHLILPDFEATEADATDVDERHSSLAGSLTVDETQGIETVSSSRGEGLLGDGNVGNVLVSCSSTSPATNVDERHVSLGSAVTAAATDVDERHFSLAAVIGGDSGRVAVWCCGKPKSA